MNGPIFTVIGDGPLSDEAIEALAALLLALRDQEEQPDEEKCCSTKEAGK